MLQIKVLIVDDDDRNIFALSVVLKTYNIIQICVAKNGVECLELLKKTSEINLVLLDMMMPIMDGYETLKKIRSSPQLKHIPVIALTAQAMRGDKEKCIDAGANDYITKPINVTELFSKINLYVNPRNANNGRS
jgi:two-component system, chemotaxis family, sensor kinase CheA